MINYKEIINDGIPFEGSIDLDLFILYSNLDLDYSKLNFLYGEFVKQATEFLEIEDNDLNKVFLVGLMSNFYTVLEYYKGEKELHYSKVALIDSIRCHISEKSLLLQLYNDKYRVCTEPNDLIRLLKELLTETINNIKNNKYDVNYIKNNYSLLYEAAMDITKSYTNDTDKYFFYILKNYIDLFEIINNKLKAFINYIGKQCINVNKYLEGIDEDTIKLAIASAYFKEINKNNLIFKERQIQLYDYINRYLKGLGDKHVVIYDKTRENVLCDSYQLKNDFSFILIGQDNIVKQLDKLSEYDVSSFKSLSMAEINDFLDELKNEFKEVNLDNVISDLNEKINNYDNSLDYNKIKQLINKLSFFINELVPIKTIEGIGLFKGYYGYVFSNGIVVLDYIDDNYNKSYGHAIYMINISKLMELPSYSKLTDIKKLDYVTCIPHDKNNKWKELVKRSLDGSKINNEIIEELVSIDIPYSLTDIEKFEELLSNYTYDQNIENRIKEVNNRKKLIKKYKQIDEEIKKDTIDETIEEIDLLDQKEEELIQEEEKDFIKLYELAKGKTKRTKRNAAVSLYTKLRSRDENGFYCCELCQSKRYLRKGLESHHIIPLKDGGPDNIYNTICLCSNCHSMVHDRINYNIKYKMLSVVRNNLIKDNIYIEEFENLFGFGYIDKVNKMTEEEADYYYMEHREEIDELFNIYFIGNSKQMIR